MKYLAILFLFLPFINTAQTGPGGVGDATSNTFWLDANEISGFSDGDDLDTWLDVSGNGLHLTQPVPSLTPEYRTGVVNGYPVVRFNKTSGTYGRLRRTGLAGFPTTEITQFIVNSNVGEANDALTSYASAGGNNDFLIFNSSNFSIYRGPGITSGLTANDGNWHIINPSWRSSDGDTRLWLDGTQQYSTTFQTGTSITTNGCFALAGEQDAIDASYAASQAHLGDFAEVLVFDFRLNQAQRIIVNNYLAAKYSIALAGNDYYAHEISHSIDVAGIGRETVAETHTAAMSDGILEVSNPSGLDNNQEYLLFGHDNGDVTSAWTTSEAPNGGVDIQRLAREWRFSEVNGDVGTIDLMVDVSTLPALPAGFSSYGLMIDSDGDFSAGAVVYELGLSVGSQYDLTALNIADGDYLALCVIDPKVEFSVADSDGFEPFSASIEISLPYIPRHDVTVEYSTSDGTALASQPDYTAATAVVATITAGSTSETLVIPVNNESIVEPDESFTVTLANPSAGVDIGSVGVHTFTIHDDDDARKIYFDISTGSGSEGTSPATVTISMSTSSATDVSVDYSVTGGSATAGPGNDYVLATGTVTISGGLGLTTSSFPITVNDDAIYESSETIIVSLFKPVGCNLDLPVPSNVGTGITEHTYTIIDNDTPPSIQFSATTGNGSEAFSPAVVVVESSSVSDVPASATYTVADGTAISGSDYSLASGTVTISAGSTSTSILAAIIDNAVEELPETFTITLSAPVDATLGANFTHTYTINDDDEFGHVGPGGVGNNLNNKLWVSADNGIYNDAGTVVASNGDRAQQWNDHSGNINNLSQPSATYRPTFVTNVINGLPAMRFNVANNRIRRTGYSDFPSSEITTISVMNTSQSGDAHVSYATSGDNNNYLLFNSANQATFIAGSSISSGHSYADGNWHILGHTWTSSDGENVLYEDGSPVYSGSISAGRNITTGGCLALGGEQDAVDGAYDAVQDFDGDIAETIIYNQKLNTAQRIIVDNYLAAKYDLTISNDLYAYESSYGHEVAGIGRVDVNNFHQDAQGSAIMRILNPTGLENSEFMIWGHDNGNQQALETTDIPGSLEARLDRVWRVSEVNRSNMPVDVGSVDIHWDLTNHGAVTASDLRLLVDTDNDGVFLDETPITGATDLGGNIYEFKNVSEISDGLRFTLGTIDMNQTPLPIVLLSFTAEKTGDQKIRLNWQTASEINNDYFTVERSTNGSDWVDVLEVPGAGNSSTLLSYTDFDRNPKYGTSYYRLKQTDFDGQFSHSEAVTVFVNDEKPILIYPNPVVDLLTIVGDEAEIQNLRILNVLGQDVTSSVTIESSREGWVRIDTSSLIKGVYLVETKNTASKVYKK